MPCLYRLVSGLMASIIAASVCGGCRRQISSAATEPQSTAASITSPDDVPVGVQNALRERAQGRPDAAVQMLSEYLRFHDDSAIGHFAIARLYFEGGALPAARSHLEQASRLDPKNPAIWNALGDVQHRSARFADAEIAFQRSAALQPGSARTWANLAREQAAQIKIEPARSAYQRAAALAPGDASILFEYGAFLHVYRSRPDDPEVAEQMLQRSAAADPSRPETYWMLGEAQLDRNRPQDSVRNLLTSTRLAPNRWEAWSALARGWRRMGCPVESRAAMDNALRIRSAMLHDEEQLRRKAQLRPQRGPAMQ